MPFTTPATSTAGTILTAAFLNTYVRDNTSWVSTDSPCCRAYTSVNLGITNVTVTPVALDLERFDNAAVHSTSSNNSRMTVPTGGAGKYLFGASWSWAVSAAGATRQGRVEVNATTMIAISTQQPSATHSSEGIICSFYQLAAADYLELYVYQDSGGGLNLISSFAGGLGNYSPEVFVYWVRT
jgi:hypothetical protein